MTKIDAKRRYRASAGGSVRQKQSFKGSILLLFGISLTLSPAFAQAQEFDIDAGPAVAGLSEFAAQADVSVVYTYDAVDGLETNKVEGVYEPDQALQLLLAGTGLSVYEGEGGAFAVATRDGGGDSDSKNLNPAPVLMAQNQTSQTQTTNSRSSEGGTSIVTGKVTDARTGANLKGAKVTIEETGQWTSTNDLGEFRFVNVPTGSATLTVSYLGYAKQSAAVGVGSDSTSQNFALRGGSEMEEIVVFGQRSARALALNQERAAENFTTVVSTDFVGQFPGTTIAEALRRVPGVSFARDFDTGNGSNIVIRGLPADLNTVKLDGVELPVGNGFERSANLGNILADSVDSIRINKTLLPSQDSAGIGGLVEIETKSPLNRPRRFGSLIVEKGERGGDYGEDLYVSGLLSGTFGADDTVGLSASVQYREQDILFRRSFSNAQRGLYLPLGPNGEATLTGPGNIDPRLSFPFEDEPGADGVWYSSVENSLSSTDLDNLTANISGALKLGRHTDLRLTIQRAEQTQDLFTGSASASTFLNYQLQPIQSLGGEPRYGLTLAGSGIGEVSFFQFGTHVVSNNEKQTTDLLALRGETDIGQWSIGYELGYTLGELERPDRTVVSLQANDFSISEGFLSEEAIDPVEGRVISIFSRPSSGLPIRLLVNDDGRRFVNDPNRLGIGTISGDDTLGSNSRRVQEIYFRYDVRNSWLNYIEAGVDLEQSRFESSRDMTAVFSGNGAPAETLGLSLVDQGIPGGDSAFLILDSQSLVPFTRDSELVRLAEGGLLSDFSGDIDPLDLLEFTEEEEVAFYVQASVNFGRLGIIGGIRFSEYDVSAANIYSPIVVSGPTFERDPVFEAEFREVREGKAAQSEVLPRLLVRYDFSEDFVLRGGYFRSIARPRIADVSRDTSITLFRVARYGPNRDQWRLRIREGNPDIKPAITDHFDLSLEKYLSNAGAVKLSVFLKEIDNLIESNVSTRTDDLQGAVLPDHPYFNNLEADLASAGTTLEVQRTRPVNAEDQAMIWGAEFAYEQQFNFLPGYWGGLGFLANFVYTESEKDIPRTWSAKPVFDGDGNVTGFETEEYVLRNISFDSAPEKSGTIAVTYTDRGWDGALSYSFQDRALTSLSTNGIGTYIDSLDTLDLRIQYQLNHNKSDAIQYRLYAEALNLLSDTGEVELRNETADSSRIAVAPQSLSYGGGTTVRIGISATF